MEYEIIRENVFQASSESIVDVLKLFNQKEIIEKKNERMEKRNIRNDMQDLYDREDLSAIRKIGKASLVSSESEDDLIDDFKKESLSFISLITNKKVVKTQDFWKSHKKELPYLYKLCLRLLSIPASSAFIERFFSITGIINSNSGNMSDDNLIQRSLFKANLKLFEDIKFC